MNDLRERALKTAALYDKYQNHVHAKLFRDLCEENERLELALGAFEHAAGQASLLLFACKGPREAFRAKELLDKALADLDEARAALREKP